MIWYRVILTNNELSRGLDKELERDFEYLFNSMNQPLMMRLYRSWLMGDNHTFYYIQMPEDFGYDLGQVFGKYRTFLTAEPPIDELTLIIGIEDGSLVDQ